jgi:hypothetical protein
MIDNKPMNAVRSIAARTFADVLGRLRREAGVSERRFAQEWFNLQSKSGNLIPNGWYQPPPNGISILAGPATSSSRINFDSLRGVDSWPSDNIIDWDEGCLYGYCSPVERSSGRPGDFAVTLYFGTDPDVRAHFRRAYRTMADVLALIDASMTSQQFFHASNATFRGAGFQNYARRSEDPASYDVGHSLPTVGEDLSKLTDLGETSGNAIDHGRRFLDPVTDWVLSYEDQVAVVAKLRSFIDPSLPQVSFQYIVCGKSRTVMRDQDALLASYNLV